MAILIPIIIAIITLGFACAVLIKDSRSQSNRLLAIGACCVLICLVGIIGIHLSDSPKKVIIWSQIILFGIISFPPAGFAFSRTLLRTNVADFSKNGLGMTWIYVIMSLFFLTILPGKGLIRNILFTPNGLTFGLTIFGKLLLVYFIVAHIHISLNLEPFVVSNFRKTLKRVAMSYIAATLFLIATGTQILLGAHLPIWMVWVACGLVASVFVTYGIFEFKRTFDRIYVSSQIIYSSILLIGTGTYFVFLGISGYFFRASHRDWSNHHLLILSTLGVFIIFLMTLFSTKIKTRIQSFWRRSIYQKKFDFREEWQHFSRMLANTLDISAMAENLISHTVRLFRIKHAALYLMGQDDGIFDFVAGSQNKSPMPQKLTLDESSKLEWDLDEAFRCNFSAALPLIVERKRLGVLFFRQPEKLRQEEFDLLSLFVDQAALAIYNLQLTSKLFEAKALQSVHKLSSFVIHDLRNHVSMLSMLLENSKKYAQRPDFRRDMMDTLESTVQDMKHLISKISISGDKSINTQAPLFINELVRKVIRELKVPKLDKVEIVEEYSIVPLVYGDETTFTALVRNLCLNAIEAMPAGGVVTVKTHCLDSSQNGALGDHKVNRDVEILVNDTGIGMSQEFIRDHVFHPFWSTKQNGLGIGLFQCKEIVESLGGRIRVDSRLGKGTTFTVSLPAMREASDERNEPIAKKLETELI